MSRLSVLRFWQLALALSLAVTIASGGAGAGCASPGAVRSTDASAERAAAPDGEDGSDAGELDAEATDGGDATAEPPDSNEDDAGDGSLGSSVDAADSDAPLDAAPLDAAPPEGGALAIAATNGPLALDFSVTIRGSGAGAVGAVAIAGDLGTVRLGTGSVPAVAYSNVTWPGTSTTIYLVLAVEPSRWSVLYFYCTSGKVTALFLEDTRGRQVASAPFTGTCIRSTAATTVNVAFPASEIRNPPLLAGHFAAQGPGLAYEGGAPGTLTASGTTYQLFPFADVDCTTCGAPGWWEVHSLLPDPAAGRACFGILYLTAGSASVALDYGICLPDLTPLSAAFSATWTPP